MALRNCQVTCRDLAGITHTVEVTADSLYEDVAQGLGAFRGGDWAGDIGRGQTTITVTRNEILYGLNQAEKFILAIVLVDGEHYEGPFYVKHPFTYEPDWAVTSITLDLDQLLTRAEHPA